MTYGDHVSRHVEEVRGTRGNVFVAPQAVDVDHFGAPVADEAAARPALEPGPATGPLVLFVGRLEEEKGVRVLLDAWGSAALGQGARLALAGRGRLEPARGRPPAAASARLATLPHPTCRRFTRPPTCSWCRRSEPQLSPSHGGWS